MTQPAALLSKKNIWNITVPIIFTLVSQNLISVIDTAFLGRVGAVELGASAIAGVFYIAVYMIGYGFSQGAQIFIGMRNGEGKHSLIGKIFANGLLFNLVLATCVFLLSWLWGGAMMQRLVSSPQVFDATMRYLDWRVFGFFFSFSNVMFRAFFVGITDTKVLTISAGIMAAVNIVFDWLLIFGNCGFPCLGIEGAAIASVLAELANVIYMIWYMRKKVDLKKYGFCRESISIEWTEMKKQFGVSGFTMVQYFSAVFNWFMFFVFIEHLGENALASSNIVRSINSLTVIPLMALATTTNTLVSNLIGAGNKDKVPSFMTQMIAMCLLLTLPIVAFCMAFPELISSIYTNDPALIADSSFIIRTFVCSFFPFAAGNIAIMTVIGSGNTKTAFGFDLLSMVAYTVFVYYTAIVLRTHVSVVWIAEYIYWTLISLLSILYIYKGNWRKKDLLH